MCGDEYTMSMPEPEWLKEAMEKFWGEGGPRFIEAKKPVVFTKEQQRFIEEACE